MLLTPHLAVIDFSFWSDNGAESCFSLFLLRTTMSLTGEAQKEGLEFGFCKPLATLHLPTRKVFATCAGLANKVCSSLGTSFPNNYALPKGNNIH